jgi:folate-dependent phosphoribosylglycinamide formyltransferase PurN
MKIVLITNHGSVIGKKILQAVVANKIHLDAIVVIRQPFKYYWKLLKSVIKRAGLLDAFFFSFRRLSGHIKGRFLIKGHVGGKHYEDLGIPLQYTKGTNSKMTLNHLKTLSPDLLILGQTGIINKTLLDIPRIGTLNAHPGILPFYRGVDCARWAIMNNEFDKVGATVHWVNEGVDTGNIIAREFYRFSGNETIAMLSEYLYEFAVSLLIKVILGIQEGIIPVGEAQSKADGIQYYKMPIKIEKAVEHKFELFLKERKSLENQ